jgi:alkanesulfonate monooxygenase SsuD/methylene tetrahydromethanopterin reductase-like flavin-dependent oxidoreductase (luciferase family)
VSGDDLEFGIILGDQPVAMDPRDHLDVILRQVDAAQRAGCTYIWIGQHFLYSGYRWMQPIPLLARLAGETGPDVKLGVSVLIVPLYHPVILAEELATLDICCGGRLVVGAGTGYTHFEFEHLQIPYEERYARLQESLELMTRLWSEDVVTFEGRFWQLHEADTHLRPIQQPRPPLWMGAMKPHAIRRAARLGDAWIVVPEATFEEVDAGMAIFDDERRRLGLPLVKQPVRREVVLGADRDDALRRYRALAQDRYLAYSARDHPQMPADQLTRGFDEWALDRAVLGTGDECVARLRQLDLDRIGPITVRPAWPGQDVDVAVSYLEQLGEQVISAFRPSR